MGLINVVNDIDRVRQCSESYERLFTRGQEGEMGLGRTSHWVSSRLMLLEGDSGSLSLPVRFHTHGSNLQESGTCSDDISISMLQQI